MPLWIGLKLKPLQWSWVSSHHPMTLEKFRDNKTIPPLPSSCLLSVRREMLTGNILSRGSLTRSPNVTWVIQPFLYEQINTLLRPVTALAGAYHNFGKRIHCQRNLNSTSYSFFSNKWQELNPDSIPGPDFLSAEDRKIGKTAFSESGQEIDYT